MGTNDKRFGTAKPIDDNTFYEVKHQFPILYILRTAAAFIFLGADIN